MKISFVALAGKIDYPTDHIAKSDTGWWSAYVEVIVFMFFFFTRTSCKLQLYFDLASAPFAWLIRLLLLVGCCHLNVNEYGKAIGQSTSESDDEISLFRFLL